MEVEDCEDWWCKCDWSVCCIDGLGGGGGGGGGGV